MPNGAGDADSSKKKKKKKKNKNKDESGQQVLFILFFKNTGSGEIIAKNSFGYIQKSN